MKSLNQENLIINSRTQLIIKNKILNNISDYLKGFDKSNVLIIVDSYIQKNKNKLNYINNSFKDFKKKQIIFSDFYEPNFKNLEIVKSKIKSKPSLIISIGGGSTLDIGKALSICLKYKGDLRNLQGQDKFNFPGIDQISIPTIFGSGAELTPSAVFINEQKGIKGGINSEFVRPKLALLDPYLAHTKNISKVAECAFDALVHSLESYTSTISNQFTKNMSIMGVENLFKGLNLLKSNDLKAYEYLATGSTYSIMSLMHSEQNFSGALSYQLAVNYNYGHALCGANFLPYSIKLSIKKKKNLYKQMISHLYNHKLLKENNPEFLISTLLKYFRTFKIKKIVLSHEQVDRIANSTITMPMLNFTPFRFTKKNITDILNKND